MTYPNYPYADPTDLHPEPFTLVMDDDDLLHIFHPERSTACGVEADGDTTDGGPEDVDCDRCLTLRSEDYREWLRASIPPNEEIVEQAWEKIGHGWQKKDEVWPEIKWQGNYITVSSEMLRDSPTWSGKDLWGQMKLDFDELSQQRPLKEEKVSTTDPDSLDRVKQSQRDKERLKELFRQKLYKT